MASSTSRCWRAFALVCAVVALVLPAPAPARPTPDMALRGNRVLVVVPSESAFATVISELRSTPCAYFVANLTRSTPPYPRRPPRLPWTMPPRRGLLRDHQDLEDARV